MHGLPPVEISVIIVNYGTADLAIAAVDSVLARRHGGRSIDVHLVDNASPGADADTLRAAHRDRAWGDRVILYPEQTNHGFGRGNNLVLRALAARPTPPDKVFLLNPDAQLDNEAIAVLADELDQKPETAIAGCAIQRPLSGHRAIAAFRFPNIIAEFTDALGVGLVQRPLQRFSVTHADLAASEDVDWVSGAGFLARFDVLLKAGFFTPDYFLYFEEVDLMHRIRSAGWTIRYVPEARIVHIAGAATGMNNGRPARYRRPSYWYESWRIYFTRNHGRFYAFGCISMRLSGWMLNYILRRLQFRQPDSPKKFILDGLQHGLLPLLAPLSTK